MQGGHMLPPEQLASVNPQGGMIPGGLSVSSMSTHPGPFNPCAHGTGAKPNTTTVEL